MDDAMNIVAHDVDHTDQWPTDVADIWRSLSCPLPKHLASKVVQECLSPGVSELYEEVLEFLPLDFEDQVETESSGGKIGDVVDTILSCARMARTTHSFNKQDEARSGWISVLTVLGIAISNDALILYGCPLFIWRHSLNDMQGKRVFLKGPHRA